MIGFFDSGIGGMTLLTQAMVDLPKENLIFYADTDNVPYGTKTKEEIIGFVENIMEFMKAHDCKAVVMACNTATAAAAKVVRAEFDFPIIGIEPAVKPAVENSKGKRVLVIATPLTIKEDKLKNLVAKVDDMHLVDMLAFPKLVEFAEQRKFTGKEVEDYIREKLEGYDLNNYSEFVLGCTHFNYFKDSFCKVLPAGINLIDGSKGTINQLKRILEKNDLLKDEEGKVEYYFSGREAKSAKELEDFKALKERLDAMRKITVTGLS